MKPTIDEMAENRFSTPPSESPLIAWDDYADAHRWHFPVKGEYPPLKELADGGNYNPLVLVIWNHSDDYGHTSKMYALDRWCPEIKQWESYDDRNIIAWQHLPEPPKNSTEGAN